VDRAEALDDVLVFQAGTAVNQDGQLVTSGGRVLAVRAWGMGWQRPLTAPTKAWPKSSLNKPTIVPTSGVVNHEMMPVVSVSRSSDLRGPHYRKKPMSEQSAYAQAGVDIAAAQRATELMKTAVQATFGPEVLSDVGNFGGLYDASGLQQLEQPVLVASTDGVGTKTKVAAALNQWDTIGYDIVNHCLNDILVQGARPLFFLDYVATARLDAEQIAQIVTGVANACRAAGCALLGGETAEMPGVYEPRVDLVGTIVGVVERKRLIDGRRIQPGDLILGLPSSGLHTNGYTLARRVLADLNWHDPRPDLGGQSIGQALLAPHRLIWPRWKHCGRRGGYSRPGPHYGWGIGR
jgi:hypothetical protein